MTEQDITELAAILINEHGHTALAVAERRRDQHAARPHSDAYRLWTRIAAATARLLRVRRRSAHGGRRRGERPSARRATQ